jgi:hypothetical protein
LDIDLLKNNIERAPFSGLFFIAGTSPYVNRKGIASCCKNLKTKCTIMRTLIVVAAALININATAQNNTAANLIEGGKTLVELVRVLKAPKTSLISEPVVEKKDSCSVKNTTDICIKNSTGKPLLVSLFRRNGNLYEPGVLSLKILIKNQECLYELKSGVYKIKLETEENGVKTSFREGEIKLNACENFYKEIKID